MLAFASTATQVSNIEGLVSCSMRSSSGYSHPRSSYVQAGKHGSSMPERSGISVPRRSLSHCPAETSSFREEKFVARRPDMHVTDLTRAAAGLLPLLVYPPVTVVRIQSGIRTPPIDAAFRRLLKTCCLHEPGTHKCAGFFFSDETFPGKTILGSSYSRKK